MPPSTKPRLTLDADTAADLMTPNPVSIRVAATAQDAIAVFVDKAISAAPVIDDAGRPIGVLSSADILTHERELASRQPSASTKTSGPQGDSTRVRDLMTPIVFSLRSEAPAAKVVAEMVSLNVHHLFVVDADGSLIGVISAIDIVRKLQ
jgi:CBS-domain-containing membrane protein